MMRTTSELQKRFALASHCKNASPKFHCCASVIMISCKRSALLSSYSQGMMVKPLSAAPRKILKRSYKNAANLPGNERGGLSVGASFLSNVMPTSVVFESANCNCGFAAHCKTCGHTSFAESARLRDDITVLFSTGAPFSKPCTQSVNRPSCSCNVLPRLPPVDCTTTMRPLNLP